MRFFFFFFSQITRILIGMQDWKFLNLELRKDESKAFEYIFQTLYPRLCAFAKQYVCDNCIAEDVVSDVMYELWKKKRTFENLEAIKSFLYISVRNKSLSYIRKQNASKKQTEEIKHISSSVFFQDHLIEEELTGILALAMEKLPEKARMVFKLSCIEGLKYKEVAEDLNITINTVKSQRSRALKLLKELLHDQIYLLFILSLLK